MKSFINIINIISIQFQLIMASQKKFYVLAWSFLMIGYIWLWCFNTNPHVLIKFLSLKAYLLAWLYYLLKIFCVKEIKGYKISDFYELVFTLQTFTSISYWFLVHFPMVESNKFPRYEINWNIYIHVAPIILLMTEYFLFQRSFNHKYKQTAIFFFLIALPINLLYSHLDKPVYQFLTYQSYFDYVFIVSNGLLILGAQFIICTVEDKLPKKQKINQFNKKS